MAYRHDPDLEFLEKCNSEDLGDLVYCLTHDPKDNKLRYTESLTDHNLYKQYYPDHQKYWQVIAEEIQRFGANTLTTVLFRRGHGVLYKEILIDVCKKFKVNFNPYSSTEKIESELLSKVVIDALEKMNSEEINAIAKEIGINTSDLTQKATSTAILVAFKKGGFRSYIILRRIINTLWKFLFGKGLPPVINATIGKVVKKAIPILWIADGIWTVIEVSNPATRVTIPAVLQIAVLRWQYNNPEQNIE
ncbi:DUF3944 domain-containing protein [Otariodibacter sp.]|uniref:DUF3944 domain-containing protein n=1 Tax=Otariodibacter sp. TaxID=3030919 RepID=UPI00262FCC57|nr:DUF3944 domain-containing protein [Otariodibacter sp.]